MNKLKKTSHYWTSLSFRTSFLIPTWYSLYDIVGDAFTATDKKKETGFHLRKKETGFPPRKKGKPLGSFLMNEWRDLTLDLTLDGLFMAI